MTLLLAVQEQPLEKEQQLEFPTIRRNSPLALMISQMSLSLRDRAQCLSRREPRCLCCWLPCLLTDHTVFFLNRNAAQITVFYSSRDASVTSGDMLCEEASQHVHRRAYVWLIACSPAAWFRDEGPNNPELDWNFMLFLPVRELARSHICRTLLYRHFRRCQAFAIRCTERNRSPHTITSDLLLSSVTLDMSFSGGPSTFCFRPGIFSSA